MVFCKLWHPFEIEGIKAAGIAVVLHYGYGHFIKCFSSKCKF
jgi:hypothetical protein